MKYVISAGGIISTIVNDKLYILFITARNGLLTFPKGHVEKNENPGQAAIREIKEEIGLKSVSIIKKLGIIQRQGTEHNGTISRKDIHLFLMKASDYTYHHEEDFVWIEYNKALKYMNKEEEKKFLKQNKKFIKNNASPYFTKFLQINYKLDINYNSELNKELNRYAKNSDNILFIGLSNYEQLVQLTKARKNIKIYGLVENSLIVKFFFSAFKKYKALGQIACNVVKPANIINLNLPGEIDIFYADDALNLSNTKTFFLINEVLKKMEVGGYFIISGKTKNHKSVKNSKKLGPNIFLDNQNQVARIWTEQFIKNSLIKKLKLKLIKIKKIKDGDKELLYFVAQKKSPYVY
ncbi:MAG: NUDIX hydrolase [Parcubacteria group bacterium Athens1014_10]|nr:MAG: NUDIX hydrolase [Parcubacteria group bacterium Athens1014_10]TSD04811.1 MAG: NUDIX hydrolase [Parcubacteria group bacterium Athens0714_12]